MTLTSTSPDWMFDADEFVKLSAEFGPFDADMMAAIDGSNAHLPVFYSEADDAFAADISGLKTWWNPPWDLIQRCMRHVLDARARAISRGISGTESLLVLPRKAFEQSGRSRRHFTVVREYPAGTRLFSAPRYHETDDELDRVDQSQYSDQPCQSPPPPPRWDPRATKFPTVVVATRGLASSRLS
jgi:hypothetical protein